MSNPRVNAPRWALSPLDSQMHLLVPEGDHPGVLKAQCGAVLPVRAAQLSECHGRPCEGCQTIFLEIHNGRLVGDPGEPEGAWQKASYSDGDDNCIEVACLLGGTRLVRDSKNPSGAALMFGVAAWAVFTAGVRAGEFDCPVGAVP